MLVQLYTLAVGIETETEVVRETRNTGVSDVVLLESGARKRDATKVEVKSSRTGREQLISVTRERSQMSSAYATHVLTIVSTTTLVPRCIGPSEQLFSWIKIAGVLRKDFPCTDSWQAFRNRRMVLDFTLLFF